MVWVVSRQFLGGCGLALYDIDGRVETVVERGGDVDERDAPQYEVPAARALQDRRNELRPSPRGEGAQGVAVTRDDAHVPLSDVKVVGLYDRGMGLGHGAKTWGLGHGAWGIGWARGLGTGLGHKHALVCMRTCACACTLT